MSHAGTVIRWMFTPLKLITIPLVWLFKHRCKLDTRGACEGIFCSVGKKGVPGWDNNYRGGEWVYRKPLTSSRFAQLQAAEPSPTQEVRVVGKIRINPGQRVTVNVHI